MGEDVKVQAFIPDWPGPKQHAAELANKTSRIYPTRILDDPSEYFNAQWQRACKELTADVLLWVMADVTFPFEFSTMCSEMERVMARGDIGWYAPDVAWTGFIYDKKDLKIVEPEVYEVPNTDSLCFAIRADVVRNMPSIDPKTCFMWGMDFTAILTAQRMGLKVVRDYRFKVQHPNSTGYDIDEASLGMKKLFESFEPSFREEMKQLINRTNNLKRRP